MFLSRARIAEALLKLSMGDLVFLQLPTLSTRRTPSILWGDSKTRNKKINKKKLQMEKETAKRWKLLRDPAVFCK